MLLSYGWLNPSFGKSNEPGGAELAPVVCGRILVMTPQGVLRLIDHHQSGFERGELGSHLRALPWLMGGNKSMVDRRPEKASKRLLHWRKLGNCSLASIEPLHAGSIQTSRYEPLKSIQARHRTSKKR